VTSPGWAEAARVLAVRLDALGDVVMTGPALRALKAARPGRRLTLLTSPAGAAAARLLPGVDGVIVYDAPWMKATPARADAGPDIGMIARLAARRFDAAAIFTVYSQSPLPAALLCFLAGIPRRLAHCHENPYQLLTDWIADPEPAGGIRHEVRRQLDLVGTVGCRVADERLALDVPSAVAARVAALCDDLGLSGAGPWVAVHPGGTAPSRRYPPEHFGEVVRGLSVAGVAVVLARARVLVSNNTGPVHVAAAVGTPVVDLYAQTNPQHTPWSVAHRVLFHDVPCKYCYKSVCPQGHHDCLRRVAPASVVAATLELLEAPA
jgi:ADP-heptose:LPS heptosyltransferase